MSASQIMNGKCVMIDEGVVSVDGLICGTVMREYKFGYHPAIEITVNDKSQWLEIDAMHGAFKFEGVFNTLRTMLE